MTTYSMGTILPKGKTQFLDGSGVPLAGGSVAYYIPATTTQLTTWQDQELSIPNANPVILDGNGEALIWGFGQYRQVVQDVNSNTIWDEVVSAPNVPVYGIDSGPANLLAAQIPGITTPYIGLQVCILPNNTNTGPSTISINSGAQIAITLGSTPISAGSIAAGIIAQLFFDGTNFQLMNTQVPPTSNSPGDIKATAAATAPAGWVLCYGQTFSRATNAALFAAIGTTWGAGDGSTTFLGPDLRGCALYGADAMGGTAANRLTTASLNNTAGAIVGATGGNELVQTHNHDLTVSDPTHTHAILLNSNGGGPGGTGEITSIAGPSTTPGITRSASTGITVTEATYGTGSSQNLPPAAVINWVMFTG